MSYNDVVARIAYRKMMESADRLMEAAGQAGPVDPGAVPNSGESFADAPLSQERNPEAGVDETEYIDEKDSPQIKTLKKDIVEGILNSGKASDEMAALIKGILKQTKGQDDDAREARDFIVKKLTDFRNETQQAISFVDGVRIS